MEIKVMGNEVVGDFIEKIKLDPNKDTLVSVKNALLEIAKNYGYKNIYIPIEIDTPKGKSSWCVSLEMQTELLFKNAGAIKDDCLKKCRPERHTLDLLLKTICIQVCYCDVPADGDYSKANSKCDNKVYWASPAYTKNSQEEFYRLVVEELGRILLTNSAPEQVITAFTASI